MPTLTRDGITLHYQVQGDGRPILLVHGFSSSFRRNWAATGWVDLLLDNGYRVVGLDVRGHGLSDKPHAPAAYDPAQLCADALAVLDAAAEGLPADLLGFSMGAGVALRLAMSRPDRFRRVAVGGIGDDAICSLADPEVIAAIADGLEAASADGITRPIARRFRAFAAVDPDNDLVALAALMRGRGWPACLDDALPIPRPVLIVHAAEDEFMPTVDRLAAAIEGARLVRLAGHDHLSMVAADAFKETVIDFFWEGM